MVDFDIGEKKRAVPPIGAFNLVLIALVVAVLSVVCLAVKVDVGSAIFGAIGLMLGGYSMGYVHKHATGNIKPLIVMSGAALLLSVLGFMMGFVGIAHAL